MVKTIYKEDLLYPELSYKIVGCAYEVFNAIGGGHKEKTYQNAMRISFEEKGIKFSEELTYPVIFKSKTIEKGRFDFFVEEKIVIELKALSFFSKGHIDQVLNYLNNSGVKLGLLISFGQNEVRVKRIVNFKSIGANRE